MRARIVEKSPRWTETGEKEIRLFRVLEILNNDTEDVDEHE